MKSPLTHFASALALLFLSIAGYIAWYSTVAAKSSEATRLERQITAASENVRTIASVRTAFAEMAGDETKVRSYFVPEESVVSFINDLEARSLAQKTTLRVLSVSTGGTPERPVLLLSLSVEGTFDAAMRTVGAIEYAPYAISVSAFSVDMKEKGVWTVALNLAVGSVSAKTKAKTL